MSSPYKTAIVTGASRGIGAAVTRALSSMNIQVTAIARTEPALHDLARETGCTPLVLDLGDTDAVIDRLTRIDADILVNNAGTMTQSAPFAELARNEIHQSVDVNLKGVLAATRAVLPGMIERRRGHLFFITSMFGPYAAPNASVYAATKAGVRAFVNCLRLELAGSRVRATEIAPGRVETEFFSPAFGGDRQAMEAALFSKHRALAPQDVADALAAALMLPEHADINRIEITSTDQALGGAIYAERPD
jgi:NADP-dependent 3-hydroxy acid dehydrogenase YdfG